MGPAPVRLIIAGGRTFEDYQTLKEFADRVSGDCLEMTVISGTAAGADTLGERWAAEEGWLLELYPANWDTYGKRAGYVRNELMAYNADTLLAFWDGESKGTKHMIDIALAKGLDVHIIQYIPEIPEAPDAGEWE
jgi:hypothetical protein